MQPAEPADQAQRTLVLEALDETLFVEAGAGTGKTTSLVGRIVQLVATGRAGLKQIAAITFTEAAAAELRDRIREELERGAAPGSAFDAAGQQRCAEALRQVDAAAIQTLHGFAQRLLLAAPLEAGLPPRIDIMDGVRSHIAFEERWELAVDTLLGESSPAAQAVLEAFLLGLGKDMLYDVAREFHDHWDRLVDAQFDPPGDPGASDIEEFCAPLEAAVAAIPCCIEPDKLREKLVHGDAYLARLRAAAAESREALVRVLAERESLTERSGRQENWRGVRPTAIRDDLKAAQDAREAILLDLRRRALIPILAVLREWTLAYAGDRRAAGTLEFHDLLVFARDLLRDNPAVRDALGQKYRRILVDEFQDTDPIQLEIVTLLATVPGTPAAEWRTARTEPGKLFFVGDPKQAIFRFRGADVELYEAAREQLGARTVQLTHNFRSVAPVIEWVNGVFEQLIGTDGATGQPRYVALTPNRPARGIGPAVHVIGKAHDTKAVKTVRDDSESPDIAGAILAIRDQGWQVADGPATRPARLQDITVVVPTRTTLESLERSLESAGIPYRVESRSLVYASQEVRDLTNILAAIDDPTNEVVLVAALRAPAFACSDRHLLQWRRAGGHWDYRRTPPAELPADLPVAAAMAALRQLHDERAWYPVNVLVERVIRERRMFELALAHRRARDHWQRLRLILDQSRRFADEGGVSLRGFVRWLLRQAEEDVAVVESVVPQPDDDAIRITTIHAAKGLEYPIVVMAGLNAARASRTNRVLWPADGPPEVRAGPRGRTFQTAGYTALETNEQQMDAYEKLRLLYVGATRAKDHLVVSLHHKLGPASNASELWTACALQQDTWIAWEPPQALAARPIMATVADGGEALAARDAWAAAREELLRAAARPAALAATAIAHEPAAEPAAEPADDAAFWRKGRGSSAIGRAVHAVLQAADLATGEGIEGLARAQAAGEGIPTLWRDVAELARAALRAPAVREAVAGGRYWREVYVAAPIDGIIVEGFIDLLYETPEGFVVVDYKTDSVGSDAEVEAAMARYRLQGGAYALALGALQEQLGRPVARCVFVFVRGSEPREATVASLPEAVAAVRARLRE
ncbi:MAG: UvrD-helicase domain-containing protein [Dehalococcoidia bacterium]|nr:UvrD-helicase domain-containing protein [Dehalococcoidia bacterium]